MSLTKLRSEVRSFLPQQRRGSPVACSQVGIGSFAFVPGPHPLAATDYQRLPEKAWHVSLEVNDACQLACRHCMYHRAAQRPDLPSEQLADNIAGAIAEVGSPVFASLSGKEPSLFAADRPDLFRRIVAALAGTTTRIMMTNGLLLDRQEWLANHVDCLDISVDGNETSHNIQRASGFFGKVWHNIVGTARHFKQVGLIATVTPWTVHGIPKLQGMMAEAFADDGHVNLSVGFFYGRPGDDNAACRSDEIIKLLEQLRDGPFTVRVLWTPDQAYLTDSVLDTIGYDQDSLELHPASGVPAIRSGKLIFILFNLIPTYTIPLRIGIDGLVYLGCGHLAWPGDTSQWAVGDLADESLANILRRCFDPQPTDWHTRMLAVPAACRERSCVDLCRGGDLVSGFYERGVTQDPRCPIIN